MCSSLDESYDYVYRTAYAVRDAFVNKCVDQVFLAELYKEYNDIPDTSCFVRLAVAQFPLHCCGLASVYLRHLIGGTIITGRYKNQNHTFLQMYEGGDIVDITSDQDGGPCVYVGPLLHPWDLGRSASPTRDSE